MKKEFPYKLYDLIPSQETMYLMFKYTFSKQISQIPTSFAVDIDLDFDLMAKALNIELERNDSLRLRFIKQDKKLKQYFLPSLKIGKVPCKYFRSVAEQEEFFSKDAQTPVRFDKGVNYRIYFYKTANDNSIGTATPIINRSLWENILIPISPQAEQERICLKIKEMLSHIEKDGI